MNHSIKKHKRIFLIGILIPGSYYFIWFLCKFLGINWPHDANLPGFIFLTVSLPWSIPILINEAPSILSDQMLRQISYVICISVGFGINLVLFYKFMVCILDRTNCSRE